MSLPCHQVDQPLVRDGPVAVLVLLPPGAGGFDDKQQRYPQVLLNWGKYQHAEHWLKLTHLLPEAVDEPVENLPSAVTGQVVAGVEECVDDGEVGLQQLFRVAGRPHGRDDHLDSFTSNLKGEGRILS